jgi:threonine/homoserine/homoserine lactone efflux protein
MSFPNLAQHHWLAGLIIGFIAAAPLGPVNLLVIQRCLMAGLASALLMAGGAIAGDIVFSTIAIFGLGALQGLIATHQLLMRLAGGLIMLLFAIYMWRQAPHLDEAQPAPMSSPRMAAVLLVMTLTNPATMLWFVAAAAAFHLPEIGHRIQARWWLALRPVRCCGG